MKAEISIPTDKLRTWSEEEELEANTTRTRLILDEVKEFGININPKPTEEKTSVELVFDQLEISEVVSEGMVVITVAKKK